MGAVRRRKARAAARRGVALVLAAYPAKAAAARAARRLVRDGILACATVAPGATAFYRWEGRLVAEGSVLLWGKTASSGAPRAVEAIRAGHPDKVPEILVLETAGALPAYAAWVLAGARGTKSKGAKEKRKGTR